MIENTIVRPLLWEWRGSNSHNIWDSFLNHQIETVDICEKDKYEDVVVSILRGDTAIFIDGYDKAMVVSSKKLPVRSISESNQESVIRGHRDSFNGKQMVFTFP